MQQMENCHGRSDYLMPGATWHVVFGMVGTLLTLFYTDYVGVAAATVGLIMLLSRFFDGFSDMIMGIIVEKTNSKWGKSRPWILWMSVPYALSAILLFTVPHTMGVVQSIYIFVTSVQPYVIQQSIFHTEVCRP